MDEKFEKAIKEFKEKTTRDCYRITLIEGEPSILDDKIGGKPYLPVGEEYPKDKEGNYLALLLQVNLKDVDLEGYPKKGILEIFTDYKVDYPCQYAVKYFEEGLEYQTDLPDIDMSEYIVTKPHKISLSKDSCYMSINDYRFFDTFIPIVNKIFDTNLKNESDLNHYFPNYYWFEKFSNEYEAVPITLGGYADFTQYDPRGISKLNINKEECLFKLDSYIDLDTFDLGDAGILFALISQEDIENCNFENTYVDWDCC